MAASAGSKPVFFWERSSSSSSSSSRHRRTKGRFSLLLLEHGEHFVDDIAVFHFPMPASGAGGTELSFQQCDALKLQGRLKLCTKSFVFEPTDVRKPLVRFPFRSMGADFPRAYEISAANQSMCSIDASGFFFFSCSTVFEMKSGDKIGPYAQIDSPNSREPFEFLFAVSHTDMGVLLARMAKLRQLHRSADAGDETAASRLLAEVAAVAPTAPFDSSKLIDFHEKLLLDNAVAVKRIRPLVLSFGHLMITDSRVYFQPAQLNNVGESTQHFDLRGIAKVYKRRYLLRDVALELILTDGESVLFGFDATQYRDYVYGILSSEPHIAAELVSLQEMTDRWMRKEISNFDYLMFINSEAGRSLSDLAQYPVFPHVIADFTSRSLDLERPETFRNLSKPVGALNPQRLQFFKDRYHSMPAADPAMGIPPPFLYGTHYSTPGYVLYYIVRVAPEHMLCLQNGKFDATDRMFISMASMWDSCLKNPADLKELIPEFFSCKSGEFLVNSADLDLGRRHNGERLDDVELPPWAKSPRDFIKKHVKALESDYVSDNLHKWIDLIFGVRQRGQLAVESDNVFYHLTYEGAVDMDSITNASERRALEVQIQEFGQTPRQIFFAPHPSRRGHGDSAESSAAATVTVDTANRAIENAETNGATSIEVANINNEKDVSGKMQVGSRIGTNMVAMLSKTRLGKAISSSLSGTKDASSKGESAPASTMVVATESVEKTSGEISIPVNDKDVNDESIVELGKDFEIEVERALRETQTATASSAPDDLTVAAQVSAAAPLPTPSVGSWVGYLRSGTSGEILSASKANLNIAQSSGRRLREATNLILHGVEQMKCHSDAVAAISFSSDGRIVSSCSKDSTMKVLQISGVQDPSGSHSFSFPSEQYQISMRRTFSASDPPLSGCAILSAPTDNEAKFVLVSSWDNTLYSYSIPNAGIVSKKSLSEDGVSSLCVRDSKVVAGCWDGSVRVWTVNLLSGALVGTGPDCSLLDHDAPVQCVALDPTGRYVASGAEDGMLTLWDVDCGKGSKPSRSSGVPVHLFNRQIAPFGRSISCLDWELTQTTSSRPARLVSGNLDGGIVCVDTSNRIVASIQLDVPVRCVRCDPCSESASLGVFVGFADGSIKILAMESSTFREVARLGSSHPGGVTSLAVSPLGDMLASGGEDGTVRFWRISS